MAGAAPGPGVAWRLRLEPGVETFTDLLLGKQQQDPAAQCGDDLPGGEALRVELQRGLGAGRTLRREHLELVLGRFDEVLN